MYYIVFCTLCTLFHFLIAGHRAACQVEVTCHAYDSVPPVCDKKSAKKWKKLAKKEDNYKKIKISTKMKKVTEGTTATVICKKG